MKSKKTLALLALGLFIVGIGVASVSFAHADPPFCATHPWLC